MANPEREMVIKAKLRQLERARSALQRIHQLINLDDHGIQAIINELDDIWWMVNEE